MMHRTIARTALLAAVMAAPLAAQTPSGTPCTLPTNAFGGSGIPTNNSMCSVLNGVTIGLSVTQRYTSPMPTTDGLGTFFAALGNSTGAPTPPGNAGFATWNFDYAIIGSSGQFFTMMIDLDPSMGTSFFPLLFSGDAHDSSNLGYFGPLFNNNADGQYSFKLNEYSDAARLNLINTVDVEVIAGRGAVTATPEPATLGLFATGLIGLAGMVKRRRGLRASEI